MKRGRLLPLRAYLGRSARGDWEYLLRVDDQVWLPPTLGFSDGP